MFTQYTTTPPATVVRDFQSRFTTIKHKLGRAARLAAAVAIGWLSLAGVASASTAQPGEGAAMSRQVRAVSLATNAPITGCVFQTSNGHYLTAVSGGGHH